MTDSPSRPMFSPAGANQLSFASACREGDLARLRDVLAAKGADDAVDVHASDEEGFVEACSGGHLGVVRELLSLEGDQRIDVHARDEGGFVSACEGGHIGVVRELLGLTGDRRARSNAQQNAALAVASAGGHLEVLRELLALTGDQHMDVHEWDDAVFAAACGGGHVETVRELLALAGARRIDVHADFNAALLAACKGGHAQVLQLLLGLDGDRRIHVNANSDMAFSVACSYGHVETVRELLALEGSRRIDVHASEQMAFCVACEEGNVDVVRELLTLEGDRRIDVHLNRDGAVQVACRAGSAATLRELLALTGERRIDRCYVLQQCVLLACENGHVDVLRELAALTGDRRVDLTGAKVNELFENACSGDRVEVMRFLLSLEGDRRVDVHGYRNGILVMTAMSGSVGAMQELLALEGDRRLDVHAENEVVFRIACSFGHVELVRCLLSLTGERRVNVHAAAEDDMDEGGTALVAACQMRCVEPEDRDTRGLQTLQLLLSLDGDRRIDVHAHNGEALVQACDCTNLIAIKALLELPRERGFDWYSDAHQAALRRAFCALFRKLSDTMIQVMDVLPYPREWVQMLLDAGVQRLDYGSPPHVLPPDERKALAPPPAHSVPLAAQLLRGMLRSRAQMRDEGTLTRGRNTVLDTLAQCLAFPVLGCGHVLSAFLDGDPLSRDPAKRDSRPYSRRNIPTHEQTMGDKIGRFVRRAAWRGLLARREAGGTDAAQCWLPPGVELRRVARRHMLLHRARRQGYVGARGVGGRSRRGAALHATSPPPPAEDDPVAALFAGFTP